MSRAIWPVFLATCLVVMIGVTAYHLPGAAEQPTSSSAPASQSQPAAAPSVREPLDLVPADSLLCWYGRPFPDVPAPGDTSEGETFWQIVPRLAGPAVDPNARLYARIIEGFGQMIRYPHALVLIDAQAKPLESNPRDRKVDRLRFALIVQTGQREQQFARIIQAAVNEHTDSQKATLTRQRAGPWTYQKLRDTRLPAWCEIAWGRIAGHFVFTIGPDVWASIAAVAAGEAQALSRSDWLAGARGERGRKALIEIIVAARSIREELDPFLDGRATEFFRAWHAEDIERMHWALGFEGPALYCVAHFVEQGQAVEHVYADPGIRDPRLITTIPEGARYAIYRLPATTTLPRFFAGLLSTRGPDVEQAVYDLWAGMQKEYGFDAQRDILAHLGDYIVMHNDPPHPLRIPFAMTTLTEIREQPQVVRQTVDTMSRAWRDSVARLVEKDPTLAAFNVREEGGIWYIACGPIAGPAWTVTDRFIVTSWSPAALRSYLEKVGERAGRRGD